MQYTIGNTARVFDQFWHLLVSMCIRGFVGMVVVNPTMTAYDRASAKQLAEA
jgi:hypothetical protein